MRKIAIVIILALLVMLVLIPSEVRAALIQGQEHKLFQQVASAYPNDQITNTSAVSSAYPVESGTPPTASFGNATQTISGSLTLTFTPTRTALAATGFVTATSSYANTAAAIRTGEAQTMQAATRNSPLYTPGTPSPSPLEGETATTTGTSMPSWTPSPSFTNYPSVITTPRVLQRGETGSALQLKSWLIGLGALGLTCFLIVGLWVFFKKR
jgi:hypothetical protein